MSADDFSNWCDGAFKIVALVGLIVSAFWGYHEYTDAKKAKRIERSMKYVNSLESKEVNNSIEHISNFWRKYDRSSVAESDRAKEIVRIVEEEEGYQKNLLIVLNHLDEIAYCIEHEICEEKVVLRTKNALFRAGFVTHFPWVLHKREITGHNLYFAHLECFITDRRPEWQSIGYIC